MNSARFPSFVPYPYRVSTYNYIYSKQALPPLYQRISFESFRDQWNRVNQPRKAFYGSYYILGALHLFLRKVIWNSLSQTGIRLNLISEHQPQPTTDDQPYQLRLFNICYEIDQKIEKREKLMEKFSNCDDTNKQSKIQASLDVLNEELTCLTEEKTKLKQSLKKLKKTNNTQNNESENQENQTTWLSDRYAELVLNITSECITSFLLYPLSVAEIWLHVAKDDATIFSSLKELLSAFKNGEKQIFDGFVAKTLYVAGHSTLMVPVFYFVRRFFNVASESELNESLRNLIILTTMSSKNSNSSVQQNYNHEVKQLLSLSPVEKKREIVSSFRAVMKNTFAHCVSDWIVRCLMYPVWTCHTSMVAQGSSYLLPTRYSSSLSAFSSILRTYGVNGFYSGFLAHSFTIFPELFTWAAIYTVVSVWIEYSMSEEIEEEEDDDEFISS